MAMVIIATKKWMYYFNSKDDWFVIVYKSLINLSGLIISLYLILLDHESWNSLQIKKIIIIMDLMSDEN